ncbi:alanine racemase [Streptomyces sp. NBC_01387]|uniref:alanine racemase n=1 Tax=unclassified Streptomyces TaxID=2593676 RepID=UPI00202436A2|nr:MULTISPECIES: alanine racemase [unclassified Streptomyces]MCX4549764.1 alanine racemase [Streptomyces sp. NBC_01500]WSC21290.1 alanine racemase [Streptomyces sp. NBC_01766]WSV55227.1 alanine racemase [Streptomyces sp. NBC_01014]
MTLREEQRRALLTVDLAAVTANTGVFRARTRAELMAVVKADGFGHGAVDVAHSALAGGASRLGVTSIDEALELRAAGLTAPVLSWLNPVDADWEAALRADVELAVPGAGHLARITAAARASGRCAAVHLHADVGMARDGAEPAAWEPLCAAAREAERQGVVDVVGVMGHLGCADSPEDTHNRAGRLRFLDAVSAARRQGLHPRHRHLAATAATLTDPSSHFDLCRIGAGLIGIDPSGSARLRPALTLTAPVVSVRDVPAGTPVGYGHTHTTAYRTRLALIPAGYADGVPRSVAGRAWVQVRGRRCPVVGRVSMDQTVVDVGADPVAPGEVVTLFGPGLDGEPTAADWARWAGTIEHEIVTGIGSRVGRRVALGTRPQAVPVCA